MHGMLSAAVLVIVFALVVAVGGGFAGWLFRAAPGSPLASRSPRVTDGAGPADSHPDRAEDAPATVAQIEYSERPVLALPAPAEPIEIEASPPKPELEGSGEPAEGARIHVLGNSRRSNR